MLNRNDCYDFKANDKKHNDRCSECYHFHEECKAIINHSLRKKTINPPIKHDIRSSTRISSASDSDKGDTIADQSVIFPLPSTREAPKCPTPQNAEGTQGNGKKLTWYQKLSPEEKKEYARKQNELRKKRLSPEQIQAHNRIYSIRRAEKKKSALLHGSNNDPGNEIARTSTD